jgi:hypothetical protein
MPVTINGKRGDRVEQAKSYNGRTHGVLEKTQNLIRLKTEQAFLRWKEARKKLDRSRTARTRPVEPGHSAGFSNRRGF